MKKIFLQGLIAGIMAATASLIYNSIYKTAFVTNFSKVINPSAIIISSIFGCLLMSLGYALLYKFNKIHLHNWLNVVIAILSFASIASPFAMSLPMDIESPELFPGLAIPMHLLPALCFFCLSSFFNQNSKLDSYTKKNNSTNDIIQL